MLLSNNCKWNSNLPFKSATRSLVGVCEGTNSDSRAKRVSVALRILSKKEPYNKTAHRAERGLSLPERMWQVWTTCFAAKGHTGLAWCQGRNFLLELEITISKVLLQSQKVLFISKQFLFNRLVLMICLRQV